MGRSIPLALLSLVFVPLPLTAQAPDPTLRQQVFAAESTFAASFARRDTAAFAALVAPDAVFFGQGALRGKAAVVEGWRGMLLEPTPPFSWKPEVVEVLESGTLALSSGPVLDPQGKRVGTFNSVWRRERDGTWLVVFDKGCPPCNCDAKKP
jgi:ketosteroid isomerase-like protein